MALLQNLGLSDCSSRIDEQFRVTTSRTYLMLFDVSDSEVYVRNSTGHALYSAHPDQANTYLVSIGVTASGETADDDGTPARLWTVDLEYGTLAAGVVPGGPLAQPPRWSLTPYPVEEPAYVDFDGQPILNSAGDPFNPPLTYERLKYTFTVTRNEASPDLGTILALSNKVNAADWLIFAAQTAKTLPIEVPAAEFDNETSTLFYPMKYSWDIDPNTWKVKVLNQGFRELKSGKLVQVMGDDGEPVNDPVLLDEDGLKLDYPVDDTSIVFKEFQLLETADFTAFDLDTILS
jgi:hypothetical protein